MPVKHLALEDIVLGFDKELKNLIKDKQVKIEVQNALGDLSIQRSIMNKFINEKVDVLVPVSTTTAQMAAEIAPKSMTVLFLAANNIVAKPNIIGVTDDIPLKDSIRLIKEIINNVKKITIIYSSTDKTFKEANEFVLLCEKDQIAVQKLMVQNLSEIYNITKNIDDDSQAIFILKDNLLASGIASLVQKANELKIPLITSDEGTVKNGGLLALGVKESQIGIEGARLLEEYFHTKSTVVKNISNINIFINKKSSYFNEDFYSQIQKAALKLKVSIQEI